MEEKICSHHKNRRRKILLRVLATVAVLLFLILFTILITWAVLKPRKPRFTLQDATIFVLNVSSPNVISTTLQVTVNSRNPNSRIGIYYEKLHCYATYRNQQITYYTLINPVYQGHKDVNIWSPFLQGSNVPVAPFNGIQLGQDQGNGGIRMTVKIDGRVKWKVGTFVSGRYHLHVTCPAFIPIGNGKSNINGVVVGNGIKYQLSQSCTVSV